MMLSFGPEDLKKVIREHVRLNYADLAVKSPLNVVFNTSGTTFTSADIEVYYNGRGPQLTEQPADKGPLNEEEMARAREIRVNLYRPDLNPTAEVLLEMYELTKRSEKHHQII